MRTPDQEGQYAKAWLIPLEQFGPSPASLCSWLVVGNPPQPHDEAWDAAMANLPAPAREACEKARAHAKSCFHPAWDTWAIQLVHLRDVEGLEPPNLHYPEAEFEIGIIAIDPEQCPIDPDRIATLGGLRYLTPFDLVKQFDGCSDRQAIRLAGLMVREICRGAASPDSDYRASWEKMIEHTVSHYKAGLHADES